jgi:hypothetical protein
MAGADVSAARPRDASSRAAVHDAIAGAFVHAFRVVMIAAAAVALMAEIVGGLLRSPEGA